MKRYFFFSLLSLLVWCLSVPVAALAGGARTVTILYTGSVKGALDPCRT